jgi:hypothetical protein
LGSKGVAMTLWWKSNRGTGFVPSKIVRLAICGERVCGNQKLVCDRRNGSGGINEQK